MAEFPKQRDLTLPQATDAQPSASAGTDVAFEARMAQQPQASYQDLYACFWSETARASLLRAIRDRLKASCDPVLDQLAFGIAR